MNELILEKFSILLNEEPDYITEKLISEVNETGILSNEETVRIIIAALFELEDPNIMENYFNKIIKELKIEDYQNNPYLKNIRLDNINYNNWKVEEKAIKPFELFVYDDIKMNGNYVNPQIGFFNTEYHYPAILENNRIWMLITPNEINTMKLPIENAHGNVLTYGLGLGYFAYMASLKREVKTITIIENNQSVIDLFNEYILPQFEFANKIVIIKSDALEYAMKKEKYDYVFVDIWHDPSDGIEIYKKFKDLEVSGVSYDYWIENTIKYYIS